MDNLTILLALTLLGHWIGHVMGFLASWTNLPMGFNQSSWIFTKDVLIQSLVGRAFGILWLVSMVAFIASAIGLFTGQSWWTTVAIIASFLSLLAFIPWWNTFTPGPEQAAVLVDVVVIAVLLGPWKDEMLARIGGG